ncbi:hypothetical protein JG676_01675 [Campylobacter sp. 2018MI35]|uniref:hypothetical protein n=1 Tax=Campylobacter sp. 2018MI34 TaxID=2800582 RepID=UPI001903EDAF|nr:hypothetical protein [Campylobacter sp. 2018MI34]MBK1991317.1 hypothetical protein [Campylobacter sp. 2018MI34]
MIDDNFLKEKQSIRQKMLKYSRAINQREPLDDELKEELSDTDDILRRRFNKRRQNILDQFNEEVKSSSIKPKKANIYLKEDLINVKLEEKPSLTKKIFLHLKEKKAKKNTQTKTKKTLFLNFKKDKKKDILIPKKHHDKEEKEIKNEDKTLNQISKTNSINNNLKNQKPPFLEDIDKPLLNQNLNTLEEDTEATKNTLLEGFSDATKEDRNLNFNHLFFVALFISVVLFLFIPQIYIRNQIYYLSREIAILRAEESVLNEENKELKRNLENIRFQNQILDYLE